MKLLVLIFISIYFSKTVAVSTEIKTKMPPKANTIPAPQKTEQLYFPQANQQSQTQFMPVQLMHKPVFLPQPQPHTMLIIAQPAYVPQNVIYGNQAGIQQQLLNYFHSNPQAKYQFLFGGYQPQPTTQTYIPQHQIAASTVPAYQIVPNPVFSGYNHLVAAPAQASYVQAQAAPIAPIAPMHQAQIGAQYVQPMQLNQLAHLAQMTAQQLRSIPPIITGLENFSPEHQAQIKAQLGSHVTLGANANLGALATPSTAPATTPQYSSPLSTQPTQTLNSNDYMQGQDKNMPQASGTTFTPSLLYRTQYTKG